MSDFNVDAGWEYEDWRKYGFYGFVRDDRKIMHEKDFFVPSFLIMTEDGVRFAGVSWDVLIAHTEAFVEKGIRQKNRAILTDVLMLIADAEENNFKALVENQYLPKVRAYFAEKGDNPNDIFATKYPQKVWKNDPKTTELMELCLAANGMTIKEYWEKTEDRLRDIEKIEVVEKGNWAYPF